MKRSQPIASRSTNHISKYGKHLDNTDQSSKSLSLKVKNAKPARKKRDKKAAAHPNKESAGHKEQRKFYQCYMVKAGSDGERCDGIRVSSGDIHKHLRTKMHQNCVYDDAADAKSLPVGVEVCTGDGCLWCSDKYLPKEGK